MPQAVLDFAMVKKYRIGYSTEIMEELDFAYIKLESGWIPEAHILRSPSQDITIVSVKDNYIFVSRHFSRAQILWVLFVRLFSFKNPVCEILSFINALKYPRVKKESMQYDDFINYQSSLMRSRPFVSVVIPTLNRYEYLEKVLADLEKQNYKNFEVVVCDQSEPVNEVFYSCWSLKIKLIQQQEKALWLARNNAIKLAQGDYIALTEDDVELPSNWLLNHLKCLDFFQADVSAGVFYKNDGVKTKNSFSIPTFRFSQQFPTGNAMLKRAVFQKVGMFDRQFEKQRMGDGEFGLRALLGGFRVISNPMAFIIDVKAPTGGLRQMGSWDAWRPTSLLSPRPIPSVLYLIRKYFDRNEAFLYLLRNIPQSYIPYKFKENKVLMWLVFLAFPIWLPISLISVLKSWNLSSQKLKQSSLIDLLN